MNHITNWILVSTNTVILTLVNMNTVSVPFKAFKKYLVTPGNSSFVKGERISTVPWYSTNESLLYYRKLPILSRQNESGAISDSDKLYFIQCNSKYRCRF